MRIGGPSLKMAKGSSPPCVADDHNCTVLEMFLVSVAEIRLTRIQVVSCGRASGLLISVRRVCASTGLVKWEIFKVNGWSFARPGLFCFPTSHHGLRRGLDSYAASRLQTRNFDPRRNSRFIALFNFSGAVVRCPDPGRVRTRVVNCGIEKSDSRAIEHSEVL